MICSKLRGPNSSENSRKNLRGKLWLWLWLWQWLWLCRVACSRMWIACLGCRTYAALTFLAEYILPNNCDFPGLFLFICTYIHALPFHLWAGNLANVAYEQCTGTVHCVHTCGMSEFAAPAAHFAGSTFSAGGPNNQFGTAATWPPCHAPHSLPATAHFAPKITQHKAKSTNTQTNRRTGATWSEMKGSPNWDLVIGIRDGTWNSELGTWVGLAWIGLKNADRQFHKVIKAEKENDDIFHWLICGLLRKCRTYFLTEQEKLLYCS